MWVQISAPLYQTVVEEEQAYPIGSTTHYEHELQPEQADDYRITPYAQAPTPAVIHIPEGGIGYGWYVVEGLYGTTWLPVPNAHIHAIDETNDDYLVQANVIEYALLRNPLHIPKYGLFAINVPAEQIRDGVPGQSELVTIVEVNGVPLPPANQMAFTAFIDPLSYTSNWDYRIYGELGAGGQVPGVATVSGFLGGGSGAVIRVGLEGYSSAPTWRSFEVHRREDVYRGMEVGLGPPKIIDFGVLGSAGTKYSAPYGEEYAFDLQNLAGLEALTAMYLFSEPVVLFGLPTGQLTIEFLTWIVRALVDNATQSGIEERRVADEAGLDIEGSVSAGVSFGIGPQQPFSLGAGASVGYETHSGGSTRTTPSGDTVKRVYAKEGYNVNIGLRWFDGGDSPEVSAFVPINMESNPSFPHQMDVGYEISERFSDLVWQDTRLAHIMRSTDALFPTYHIPGSLQEHTFFVELDQEEINDLLHSITTLPPATRDLGSAAVTINVDNESFKRDFVRFLETLYDQQNHGTANYVNYGIDVSGIDEFEIDLVLEVPIPAAPLAIVRLGGGMRASHTDSYELVRGRYCGGIPLLTSEVPIPPVNGMGLWDVVGELWTRVLSGNVWQTLLEAIREELYDLLFSWGDTSLGVFVISPNGSTLELDEAAVPAGVDSVYSRFWEWGHGPLKATTSPAMAQKLDEYIEYARRVREEIAGMRYGIGGFCKFEPEGTELLDTARLTIRYLDAEIEGLDESTLGVFYQDSTGAWRPVVAQAFPDSNKVVADIDAFWTYTLAPRMAQGQYEFGASPDSLPADGVATALLISDVLYNNDGTPVSEGTLFTASATSGTIVAADADTSMAGIQVPVTGGVVGLVYQASDIPIVVEVAAQAVNGFARCSIGLKQYDTGPPEAPVITSLEAQYRGFKVRWERGGEADLSGYFVHFDIDQPGPPYNGVASVWGQDSPISVGMVDSLVVAELEPDNTYYVALTAMDVSGHHSVYSEEFTVIVGIGDAQVVPRNVRLSQNHPNPFNPTTIIEYELPEARQVELRVYDLQGRVVRVLVDERRSAGVHRITWDGTDERDQRASGVYFYRMEAGGKIEVKKMVLVR